MSFAEEHIRVCYEIFEFFTGLKDIYFTVIHTDMLIVFEAKLDILSSYFVTNRTEVAIL